MHRLKPLGLTLLTLIAATALSAAPALASGKPFVETKSATAIAETTATLHGAVNLNGAETKYSFEYGPTASYGTKTAEASAGSGLTTIEESKAITGLTTGTTYHFRVVAKNANGTSDGSDAQFTTAEKAGLPEFKLAAGEAFPVKLSETVKPPGGVNFSYFSIGSVLDCATASVTGEITSGKKVSLTDTMSECRLPSNGVSCKTAGAENGVVVMTGTGAIAYIKKATKLVGAVLALKTGLIQCENNSEAVSGSIISPLTPINTKTTSIKTQWEEGLHSPSEEYIKYENEKGEEVPAFPRLAIEEGAPLEAVISVPGGFTFPLSKAVTLSA